MRRYCVCWTEISCFGKELHMIKLLCLDIDGTLLNSRKELPEENVEAVRWAANKGVVTVLASGRSMQGVRPILKGLGCEKNAVCLDGGLILYKGCIIYRKYMDLHMIYQVLQVSEKYHTQVFATSTTGNLTAGNLTARIMEEAEKGSMSGTYDFCQSYQEMRERMKDNDIIKMAVQDFTGENFRQTRQQLERIPTLSILRSDTYFLDIIPADSGKEKGIRILADYLRIAQEEIMCIGDNENDLEMLQAAGLSVAMGNASEEVKKKADVITEDNDHAGVAKAIYQYLR